MWKEKEKETQFVWNCDENVDKEKDWLDGAMVSMQAFQACGPGSIPGQVTFSHFFILFLFLSY